MTYVLIMFLTMAKIVCLARVRVVRIVNLLQKVPCVERRKSKLFVIKKTCVVAKVLIVSTHFSTKVLNVHQANHRVCWLRIVPERVVCVQKFRQIQRLEMFVMIKKNVQKMTNAMFTANVKENFIVLVMEMVQVYNVILIKILARLTHARIICVNVKMRQLVVCAMILIRVLLTTRVMVRERAVVSLAVLKGVTNPTVNVATLNVNAVLRSRA
mmetsp:Transcript_2134/g.3548  ORF Transcript_2134/g.3548 Transcript_2134/m.3548 type:complete len:213 (+) Transcript_2134:994-1632(+)